MSDLMQASSFNTDLVITSNNLRKFLEPIFHRERNGPRTIPCCKNQSLGRTKICKVQYWPQAMTKHRYIVSMVKMKHV